MSWWYWYFIRWIFPSIYDHYGYCTDKWSSTESKNVGSKADNIFKGNLQIVNIVFKGKVSHFMLLAYLLSWWVSVPCLCKDGIKCGYVGKPPAGLYPNFPTPLQPTNNNLFICPECPCSIMTTRLLEFMAVVCQEKDLAHTSHWNHNLWQKCYKSVSKKECAVLLAKSFRTSPFFQLLLKFT